MNVLLWVLQGFLALHTAMGAVWKFSNSEQAVPSLSAVPHGVWLGLGVVELICTVCLILPAFARRGAKLAPVAAAFIAAEMLFFTGVHLAAGAQESGPMIYWLVTAVFCVFVAFGRFVLRPHR